VTNPAGHHFRRVVEEIVAVTFPTSTPKPTTHPLGPRPRPDSAARAANLAWELQRRRLETSRQREVHAHRLADDLPALVDNIDRRFEALEAAISYLAALVEEIRDEVAA
jgi:hypothetical protein